MLTERRPDHVSYAGWESIDRLERSLGEPHGRPRVKICSREELLEAALGDSQEPDGGEAEVASPTAP